MSATGGREEPSASPCLASCACGAPSVPLPGHTERHPPSFGVGSDATPWRLRCALRACCLPSSCRPPACRSRESRRAWPSSPLVASNTASARWCLAASSPSCGLNHRTTAAAPPEPQSIVYGSSPAGTPVVATTVAVPVRTLRNFLPWHLEEGVKGRGSPGALVSAAKDCPSPQRSWDVIVVANPLRTTVAFPCCRRLLRSLALHDGPRRGPRSPSLGGGGRTPSPEQPLCGARWRTRTGTATQTWARTRRRAGQPAGLPGASSLGKRGRAPPSCPSEAPPPV